MFSKTLWKYVLREIRMTPGRFFSIVLMIGLGAFVYTGLVSVGPKMRYSLKKFQDETNMADLQISSTFGLDDEDLKVIKSEAKDAELELSYRKNLKIEGTEYKIELISKPERLERAVVTEGRLPEAFDEILVDANLSIDKSIGDSITFEKEKNLIELPDDKDALNNYTFKIVGKGRHCSYLVTGAENASAEGTPVSGFAIVPKEAFLLDKCQVVTIRYPKYMDLYPFGEEYRISLRQEREKLQNSLKNLPKEQLAALKEKVSEKIAEGEAEVKDARKKLSEAEEKLNDAQKKLAEGGEELKEGKSKLERETADGQKKINKAELDLKDGRKKLDDAKIALSEKKKELEDGEKKFSDGKKEYEDGKKKYQDGLREYEDAKAKLEDGKREYEKGLKEYEENKKKLEEGRKAYEKGLKEFESGLSKYQDGTEKYRNGLSQYESGQLKLQEAKNRLDEALQKLDEGRQRYQEGLEKIAENESALNEKKSQAEQAISQLQAAIEEIDKGLSAIDLKLSKIPQTSPEYAALLEKRAELEAKKSAFEMQKSQAEKGLSKIEAGFAEIKAAKERLESSKAELDSGELRYKAGLSEYNEGLEKAKAGAYELEKARAELAAASDELSNGRKSLDDAKRELDDGEIKLSKGKKELEEAAKKIEENEKKLADGKRDLEKAESELKSAETKLKDGEAELSDGRKKLKEAEDTLEEKEKEYRDGLKKLNQAKKDFKNGVEEAREKLSEAEIKLKDGESEYSDGKERFERESKDADRKLREAEEKIDDAKELMLKLKEPIYSVKDRTNNAGYNIYYDSGNRLDILAFIFPVFFYFIALLVSLTTLTRTVETYRGEIGTLKGLGYSNLQAMLKFLVYGGLSGLLGGIIGGLSGEKILSAVIFNTYGTNFIFKTPPDLFNFVNVLIGIAIGLITGLFSVWKAAKPYTEDSVAVLMRPKIPKAGSRLLLERIGFIWNRFGFMRKITLRNMFRYKLRMFMTVFGVAGCVSLLLFGFAIRDSIAKTIPAQYGSVATYNFIAIYDKDLGKSYMEEYNNILKSDAVKIHSSVLVKKLNWENYNGMDQPIVMIVPENSSDFPNFFNLKEPDKNGKNIDLKEIVITDKLAKIIGETLPKEIPFVENNGKKVILPVSRIANNYLWHYIFLSPENYEKFFGERPDYNADFIILNDGEDKEAFYLKLSENKAVLNVTKGETKSMENLLVSINFVVLMIIIISSLLAIVVLYNLNNINIEERIRELSTVKVLGFYPLEMTEYIYRETVMLTIIAIIPGFMGGIFITRLIMDRILPDAAKFYEEVSIFSYILSVVITVIFSIIVMSFVHKKLKKIDMVEALKGYE